MGCRRAVRGGVIGAGFASGQELIVFFVNYGSAGLVGALWAVLLLLLGTGLILESCAKHRASSYGQLFRALDRKLSILLEGLYGLFLLVGSSVMFAGMGAAASSPGKDLALRICSALLVYAILRGGVSSVVKVGGWLAPLLAVGLLRSRCHASPPAAVGSAWTHGGVGGALACPGRREPFMPATTWVLPWPIWPAAAALPHRKGPALVGGAWGQRCIGTDHAPPSISPLGRLA